MNPIRPVAIILLFKTPLHLWLNVASHHLNQDAEIFVLDDSYYLTGLGILKRPY